MANKSGKKLAPTKKEWEPSASRLAGGGEGAVLIPPVPLIQEDSGSFRGPLSYRFILFPWSQKDGKLRTASHPQRRGLWFGGTSKVKTLAPEQNVPTDLKETVQWSEARRARAGLDST